MVITTEMESTDHETVDPDSKYPLKVLYCGGKTILFSIGVYVELGN